MEPAEEAGNVVVERLSNVWAWEMYRFAEENTDQVVCKVALRVDDHDVEYGIWSGDDAEPSATGTVEWGHDEKEWGDEAREEVLREIMGAYEEKLPLRHRVVEFEIGDGTEKDGGDDAGDDEAWDDEEWDEDDDE